MTTASTAAHDLASLVQGLKPFYLGGMLSMDYHRALVFLHDHEKRLHGGLPENAFLLATSWFLWNDPDRPSKERLARDETGAVPDDANDFDGTYRLSEHRVMLLRVVGPAPTLNDDQVRRAIMEFHQRWRRRLHDAGPDSGGLRLEAINAMGPMGPEWFFQNPLDGATKALLQHGAVECELLGTFFDEVDEALPPPSVPLNDALTPTAPARRLVFAKATEDLLKLPEMAIYRPSREALHTIVNYAMPHSLREADRQVEALSGDPVAMGDMRLGVLRYGPADRLQRHASLNQVAVCVHPGEFLARRTAMLGMTRTGKSNAVKLLVSELAKAAHRGQVQLGQLIFDINAEYSHDNWQDGAAGGKPTSLASALGKNRAVCYCVSDTVMRHRRWTTHTHLPEFHDLRENFYLNCESGLAIVQQVIQDQGQAPAEDLQALLNMDLSSPWGALNVNDPEQVQQRFLDAPEDAPALARFMNQRAIFQALLYRSGFSVPEGFSFQWFWQDVIPNGVSIDNVVALIRDGKASRSTFKTDQRITIDPHVFMQFLRAVRAVDQTQHEQLADPRDGQPWLDDFSISMLNLMVEHNKSNKIIRGYRDVQAALPYHSPNGQANVTEGIYDHLAQGQVVILDLSGGKPSVREFFSRRLVQYLFERRLEEFAEAEIDGKRLAPFMLYVEEAHNLIGLNAQLDDTWPRIAKEGAKLGLGLVYSTQEVSSVHHNILSNTENFFITHLNNHRELKCLADYGDFDGFIDSIRSSSEPGFARLNTKSLPYTLPIQVDAFAPVALQAFFADVDRSQPVPVVPTSDHAMDDVVGRLIQHPDPGAQPLHAVDLPPASQEPGGTERPIAAPVEPVNGQRPAFPRRPTFLRS